MPRSRKRPYRALPVDLEWVRARQALVKRLRREVDLRVGEEPREVKEFRRRYEREIGRTWRVAESAELIEEMLHANICFGGDFHAFGQAQRAHLRLLRAIPKSRPLILALESFPKKSQAWLDRYLAGKITEEELRVKAKWSAEWGFPWENYRPLLEFAKRRGARVIGLNQSFGRVRDLAQREKIAAGVIARAHAQNPEALLYVLFGDLHVSAGHLPKQVREIIKTKQLHTMTIHLNCEAIYFQLARAGRELEVEIVRFAAQRPNGHVAFCLLSSPPWVLWQGYLLFLERSEEVAELEISERDDESGDFDPTDQVASLVRLSAQDLKAKISTSDLAAYAADSSSAWASLERSFPARDLGLAREALASGHNVYSPKRGSGYLGHPTVNHAASLAGEYIHAKLSGRTRVLWQLPRDFDALIWSETVAYFFSKLVNHRRRAPSLNEVRLRLANATKPDAEAFRLALDRAMSDLVKLREGRSRKSSVKPRRRASYLEAARILGGLYGERLYMSYRSRKLKVGEIMKLLRLDVTRAAFVRELPRLLALISS